MDGHVVEGDGQLARLPVRRDDGGLQRGPLFGDEVSGGETVERFVDPVPAGSREKPDSSEIDPEHRHRRAFEEPSPAKQRAVAAQGDQRIERGGAYGLEVPGPVRLQRGLGEKRHAEPLRSRGHPGKNGREPGIAGVADDADVHRASKLSS